MCRRGFRHLLLSAVDFGEIAQRHSDDLSHKSLNTAVTVRLPTSSDEDWNTHYCLCPQERDMAEDIDRLKDSHVFQLCWEETARSLARPLQASEPLGNAKDEPGRPVVTLDEAYTQLYLPCHEKFLNLYVNLQSGDITLAEVDVMFKDFVNKYGQLVLELQAMCRAFRQPERRWIYKRINQIQEYHSLHQAASAAREITQVKESLGLTGNFSVLHTLLNFVSRCWEARGRAPEERGTWPLPSGCP